MEFSTDAARLSASTVGRLANQRLHFAQNEVTDYLDADSLGVNASLEHGTFRSENEYLSHHAKPIVTVWRLLLVHIVDITPPHDLLASDSANRRTNDKISHSHKCLVGPPPLVGGFEDPRMLASHCHNSAS
ncbi:hypothetical protein TNCV_4276611 [Trichonephila clavipes]|nr:hypothetical protein TNCV_4276611 [Trichonephila clavipes]